jgi:hypothetical protein
MKNLPQLSVPNFRRIARLAPILLAAGTLAAGAAEPAGAAPKTHRLFMGSNLSVVSKDLALPVRGVQKNSFIVRGPEGDLVVDPQDRQFRLKIDDALKLTATIATIDDLAFERTYTPGNDPMQKFADAARTEAYMAENSDAADANQRNAEAGVGIMGANLANANRIAAADPTAAGNGVMLGQAQANLTNATSQADTMQGIAARAQTQTGMDAFSSVSTSNRLSSELGAEAYDAVRVTFKVSAPRPMATPYAVIFMRFLEEKDRPDTANVWVYAEKLPDIDEQPRNITILRGGFPPGYHIDSHHVHLYEGTTEIATNVSRKLVALTTDEAFQYAVIQHITNHRNQTREPAKAQFFWPADLSTRLLPDKLTRTVYVKVDKTGKALGIFEDEAGRTPASDPEIAGLAPELRFFPALDKGKPVEGIAAVKLGSRN